MDRLHNRFANNIAARVERAVLVERFGNVASNKICVPHRVRFVLFPHAVGPDTRGRVRFVWILRRFYCTSFNSHLRERYISFDHLK